mmetsp:Transcript_59626/g.156765  ORF Transcript_59626/g.156765 Transcript_59626/m.156765 type:complete len:237 (+) Transcript_59626:46-756(+)
MRICWGIRCIWGVLELAAAGYVQRSTVCVGRLRPSLGAEERDDVLRAVLQRDLEVDEALILPEPGSGRLPLGDERLGIQHIESISHIRVAGDVRRPSCPANDRAEGHEQLRRFLHSELLHWLLLLRAAVLEEAAKPTQPSCHVRRDRRCRPGGCRGLPPLLVDARSARGLAPMREGPPGAAGDAADLRHGGPKEEEDRCGGKEEGADACQSAAALTDPCHLCTAGLRICTAPHGRR